MIKASELRIGNLVYWNEPKKVGVPHRVIRIMENRINTVPISLGNSMEDYSPIPLSEGLLVVAGFAKHESRDQDGKLNFYMKGDFSLDQPNPDPFIYWADDKAVYIWYLHHLQNLFFALTGEELSFDLSLVGAGLGDSLSQPPAAEAIRAADSVATQDENEPYFGWCDVDGCENEGCSGGGAWRRTGYWTVCSKHSQMHRDGAEQPKMKQAAIDREATRLPDGCLPQQ